MSEDIELGDKVQDVVSGFTGIVISKHFYIDGYISVSVQPTTENENVLPDSQTFNPMQLKLITKNVISL